MVNQVIIGSSNLVRTIRIGNLSLRILFHQSVLDDHHFISLTCRMFETNFGRPLDLLFRQSCKCGGTPNML